MLPKSTASAGEGRHHPEEGARLWGAVLQAGNRGGPLCPPGHPARREAQSADPRRTGARKGPRAQSPRFGLNSATYSLGEEVECRPQFRPRPQGLLEQKSRHTCRSSPHLPPQLPQRRISGTQPSWDPKPRWWESQEAFPIAPTRHPGTLLRPGRGLRVLYASRNWGAGGNATGKSERQQARTARVLPASASRARSATWKTTPAPGVASRPRMALPADTAVPPPPRN